MKKSNLRKVLMLLVCLALTLSVFTGCSPSANETTTDSNANTSDGSDMNDSNVSAELPSEIGPELKVGFAQSGNPNPWMVALTESMEDTFSDTVSYTYTDANDDMATHVSNIENMLNQGLDILVVAPMEDTGLEAVLDMAKEQGVPVILSGRTTLGEYVTTVYSDQAWEGERCAELIGGRNPSAKVVELRGIEGTSSVAGREKGFRDVMAEKYPDMEIVAEQTANFSREEAMNAMAAIIQSQGAENIDAVYCHNDEMALGAVQAIKDAGLTPGEDILVVGIDGQREAWEAVKSGEMLATVTCSPKHGPTVQDVIEKILKGEPVEKETIIPDQVITAENASECEDLVF